MSIEPKPSSSDVSPITRLDDPRAVQLLISEQSSLMSARSLAYNEAFVRAGMFLSFLSMSFVALALLAQAMAFGRDYLSVAALVLTFVFVVGVTTLMRMNGANLDDLRAAHGMARIRHAYTEVAPMVKPYFTAPVHDDVDAVTAVYGIFTDSLFGQFVYGLSTSSGMIALIVSMIGGVLATVFAMLAGVSLGLSIGIGMVAGIIVLLALFGVTGLLILREQARIPSAFPTPEKETG